MTTYIPFNLDTMEYSCRFPTELASSMTKLEFAAQMDTLNADIAMARPFNFGVMARTLLFAFFLMASPTVFLLARAGQAHTDVAVCLAAVALALAALGAAAVLLLHARFPRVALAVARRLSLEAVGDWNIFADDRGVLVWSVASGYREHGSRAAPLAIAITKTSGSSLLQVASAAVPSFQADADCSIPLLDGAQNELTAV